MDAHAGSHRSPHGDERTVTRRGPAPPAARTATIPPAAASPTTSPSTALTRRPPALVAVGHGSRDPRAARVLADLAAQVRILRPGTEVEVGYVELNRPLVGEVLAGLAGEVVVVPLLFGRGHHVKHDLPYALAAAAHLRGAVAAPLGPHPLLARALHDRLAQAGWTARGQAVVLAAAGSRDPEPVRDTERTAALLAARLGGVPVVPAYASAARPTVPQAVAELAGRGLREIAVASCFTAPGRFAAQSAAAAPWIVSAPLGAHPALAELVLRRYDEACAG
ncbi:sirohydrochlorin chelatase [Streptomyces sp. NPDC087270]|uniref:sirohydrochlorin chelatase n=1 Tax=Streptomyces sp. NPDC087270 TaxID=3365774 RepID=UPI00382E3692